MVRSPYIVILLCAAALAVGCDKNKKDKQMASSRGFKAQKYGSSTTQPSDSKNIESASARSSTTQPTAANQSINPLAGYWQMAIPRRQQQEATIIARDATHVTIQSSVKNLSGDYIVQGNYLLILTRDERLRNIAWKINSNDSLTVVRSPDFGAGRTYTGVSLLRAPEDSSTAADMGDMWGQ